jgi:predicted nucleotidyltransferase
MSETWQAPVMHTAILPSPRSVSDYCHAHAISRLRLFGSATRGDFDPLRSDLDLLVEYEPGSHPGLDHFRIAEELSELFGRKVDLNTPAMLGRHLEKVLPEARLLYGKA